MLPEQPVRLLIEAPFSGTTRKAHAGAALVREDQRSCMKRMRISTPFLPAG